MYVSPCGNYAYLATPRTASNSIARLLKRYGFTPHLGHHSIDTERARQIHTVAASVRFHHDTIVSWYYLVARKAKCENCGHERMTDFGEFLSDLVNGELPRRHAKYFMPRRLFGLFTHYATDLIYYETMTDDVQRIFGSIVGEVESLDVHNETTSRNHRPWQQYFTADQELQITANYDEEMRELGYTTHPSHEGGRILQRTVAHTPVQPLLWNQQHLMSQREQLKQKIDRSGGR